MLGNEVSERFAYKGRAVELVACWDSDTPENQIDFWDLYVDGECYTLGDPFFARPSMEEMIEAVEFIDDLHGR